MKIFELFGSQPLKPEVDFDLHDDLMFFMNNDPEFYRQDYFPFLDKFTHHCNAGRVVSPKAFSPMVIKAYKLYKNKFPIKELEEDLSDADVKDICEKLQSQQLQHYHNEKEKKLEKKNETKRTV